MKTTFIIKETHCNACKMLIEDVCKDVPGVSSCTVDFTTGKTEVEHESTLDWQAFKKEVESAWAYTLLAP